MKISVITVCLNSADTIERTINSVMDQEYKDIEYIIIDGLSNDGTIDIINKYQNKINFFLSEKDEGIYHALNKGLKFANGDIISILKNTKRFNKTLPVTEKTFFRICIIFY